MDGEIGGVGMSAWIIGLIGVFVGMVIGGAVSMVAMAAFVLMRDIEEKAKENAREFAKRWGMWGE